MIEKKGKRKKKAPSGADLLEQGKGEQVVMEALEQKQPVTGRPTIKTPEIIDLLLLEIMAGKSLVKICGQEGMPVYSTVCSWLANDKDFSEKYARARAVQADYLFEEALDIADDASDDEKLTEDGRRYCNKEFVQRSRLRVDTRLRMVAKMVPKKYGEKITNEISGPDGGPLQISDLEAANRLAHLIQKAKKRKAEQEAADGGA